jgi:hypothetical protein
VIISCGGTYHNLFFLVKAIVDILHFLLLSLLVCRPNKVTLQIVNVALQVHQVLFIFSVDLDPSEAFGSELLRVINVNNLIFIVLFVLLLGDANYLIDFISVGHLIFFVSVL